MNRWMKVAVGVAAVALSGSVGAAASVLHSGPTQSKPVFQANAVTLQSRPESLYVPIAPCRVIDTRGHGILKRGTVRNFYVAGGVGFAQQGGRHGGCGVPRAATAVAITYRDASPSAAGSVRTWADATSEPATIALSWTRGASVGASTTQTIVAGPGLDISARAIGANTHLVADVLGYYVPQIQALVAAGGTISSGTPRVVSVSHAGTGFYYLTLDRPARECVPTAVTYNYGHYASVGLSSTSTPNVVSVFTWNVNNTGTPVLADESFFFSATC